VTLSSADPNLTMGSNTAVFAEIGRAETVTVTDPLNLEVSAGVSTPYTGVVTVVMTDDAAHAWTSELEFLVMTSTTLSGEVTFDGAPARNAGTDAAGIAYDINWFPRDYTPDIGAFEHPRTDMDADGLPDDWEIHFFEDLDTSDGTGNDDLDAQTDGEEEIAGSDPTDRDSVFEMTHGTPLGDTGFIIRWLSVAERLYFVDSRSNLLTGTWVNIATNLIATPPENVYTVQTENADTLFNRVWVRKQ